jgi:hypothetical protein
MRFRAAIVVAAAVLVAAAPAGAAATGGHAANTSFGADLLAGEATPLAGAAQTEAFAAQGRRPQWGRYGGGGFVPGRFF